MVEPINPVTFYGDGPNLTIHRVWLVSNLPKISDGQHNFNPKEKKTLQIPMLYHDKIRPEEILIWVAFP